MDRRTIITAAPAVLLAGVAPSRAEGVTSNAWALWEQALAEFHVAHAETTAIAERNGGGCRTEEFQAAEEREGDLWAAGYDRAITAYRTPAITAADVLAKARIIAINGLDADDWHDDTDAELIEQLVRDLAAAHGVAGEVAAILDPIVAKRNQRRARLG